MHMAQFMVQVAYSQEAWASLVKGPQDRIGVVSAAVEKLGGKLVQGWLSFGDYDTVCVLDMPDYVAAAAFAAAIAAGGSCKSVKTTPLLSPEEGVAAMKKAGGSGYKPIGK
jgi:uncharacterized protein with GYD domain